MKRKNFVRSICLLTLFLFPAGIFAEENVPNVKAMIDKNSITIGEPLLYQIDVTGNLNEIKILPFENERYFIPKEDNKKTKDIDESKKKEVADYIPEYIIQNVSRQDEEGVITVKVQIVFYRPGKYTLPLLNIKYQGKEELGYAAPNIEVKAVSKKPTFNEIEAPLNLKGNYTRIIILVIAAILLAIAIFFLVKYILAHRRKKEELEEYIPPIVKFMDEIHQLNKSDLINEDVEAFVDSLSSIFRRFLAEDLKIDTLEKTTDELYVELKKHHLLKRKNLILNDLQQLMTLWDFSKFAEFSPSIETLELNLEKTISTARAIDNEVQHVSI